MEPNKRPTATYSPDSSEFDVETRLNTLLSLNQQDMEEKALFQNENEELQAKLLKNPIKTEKAYAMFGLLLGIFPPLSIFSKIILDSFGHRNEIAIAFLLILANLACAMIGYFSGKLIGKVMIEVQKLRWVSMIALSPFVGILWGILTGGGGGLFILIFGAIFGAMIAAVVGGAALPVYAVFHRLLKRGDSIEQNHFLPIAFGITFTISAFILSIS